MRSTNGRGPRRPLRPRLDRPAGPLCTLPIPADRSRPIPSNSRRLAPSARQQGSTETTVAAPKVRR